MQIAIAQMRHAHLITARINFGQAGIDQFEKRRDLVQGQRYVRVDRRFAGIGDFSRHFAAFPHGAALLVGLGNLGIQNRAIGQHCGQCVFQKRRNWHHAIFIGRRIARCGHAQFDQNGHGMMRGERLANVGPCRSKSAHVTFGHIFKSLDSTAAGVLQLVQQSQRIGQRPCGKGGGGIGPWARHQFHNGCGDHAQCALSPDEKIFQIVTGIVFMQLAHQIKHASIRQNHL